MDVTKILAELKEERHQIEEAILSLERLARGRGRRRGRPLPGCPGDSRRQTPWPSAWRSKNKVRADVTSAAPKGAVA